MQNAIKNKYYKKPNDIYPPTEHDFDESIHKFVSDKNNLNNQRVDELLESENKIRYQDPSKVETEYSTIKDENMKKLQVKRPETFYIPNSDKIIMNDVKNGNSKTPETFVMPSFANMNPQILIIIIIVMLMVIIYLYCKVENLQTLNKIYSENLIKNKNT